MPVEVMSLLKIRRGAALTDGDSARQRLLAQVCCVDLGRLANCQRAVDPEGDSIGVDVACLAAHALDVMNELARDALTAEFIGEPGI